MDILALTAGGGQLALAPMPGSGGEYARDLNAIEAWGADVVVSMTTSAEMSRCGAGGLERDLHRRGIRWEHMPIEDFGSPAGDVARSWSALGPSLQQVLTGGGRVLVHCRGGCGRSGMVVLRLMVECGENPDAALTRLRAVRPCAVETEGQMAWAVFPARTKS